MGKEERGGAAQGGFLLFSLFNMFLAINRRPTFTVESFTRTLRPSSFVYPVYSEREHVYVRTADHIADLLDFDKVVSFLIQVVSIF